MCLVRSSGDFWGSPHRQDSIENLQMMERKSQSIAKQCGWEDEEKRLGSKFAACTWIYTTEVLTGGQIPML